MSANFNDNNLSNYESKYTRALKIDIGSQLANLQAVGSGIIDEIDYDAKKRRNKRGLMGSKKNTRKIFTDSSEDQYMFADMMQSFKADAEEIKVASINTDGSFTLTVSKDLLGKKGTEIGEIATQSYYNDPVDEKGFTRNAGGASEAAQKEAIKEIITVGRRLDATEEEIAYSLAIARYESWFNKYAAAKSSSAYGIGQFIDKTGAAYGLNQDNRDDLGMQAQVLIEHTQDNLDLAKKRGKSLEYAYKYHHDGPSKDSGGLAKSKEHVIPYIPKYLKMVKEYN